MFYGKFYEGYSYYIEIWIVGQWRCGVIWKIKIMWKDVVSTMLLNVLDEAEGFVVDKLLLEW